RSIDYAIMHRAGQHSSSLDQLGRQVDAVDPASITVREVPRRPANAAANIENPAILRKCNPLSQLASGGQAPRMKMLEGSKGSGSAGRVPVQSARRRSVQARQVASNALEHLPSARPWRSISFD